MYNINLLRSVDDVIVVETPFSRVVYDGETIELENTRMTHSELRGLCGNPNMDKRDETVTAQGCVAKSIYTAAISYRVQDRTCSTLSQYKQHIYQHQQQQQCKTIKSQQQQQKKTVHLTQLALKETEECSQMRHALIQQGNTICISQVPVVQCGNGCDARTSLEKVVPFTCLPTNRPRVIRLYEEKVRRGELLPELRNMENTFKSEMEIPTSCALPGILKFSN